MSDCLAFSTAQSFPLKSIYDAFRDKYRVTSFRDSLHFEIPYGGGMGDVFLFPYGSLVVWEMPRASIEVLMAELRPFEIHPLTDRELDEFTFVLGDACRVADDEIMLPNNEMWIKLAISHGIAQSVKLSSFETRLQKSFHVTREIPEDLYKQGRIPLSRKKIRQQMGGIFLERSSINLHLDILDLPDFFWEYPELEPYYKIIANYLDVKQRVEVLNKRLDILHEFFEMLGSELNHQHSNRLEMIIILLIVVEVVLTLLRDVFRVI